MLLGSVQMYGEKLSTVEVQDICDSLILNDIRLLSLRDCTMSDVDFEKLMISVSKCKSIHQLNLNLGMLSSCNRSWKLANALNRNRSLSSLFLHGSTVGERGMCMVLEALTTHPNIVSLDVGDCLLKDSALSFVSKLLPPNGAKRALQDLSLSANPGISPLGWTKFFLVMAADNSLQNLSLDYNPIGDYGVGCLSISLVNCRNLQTLDLEGCGIDEGGAEVLLHLTRNFPVSLKQVILAENTISRNTINKINAYLEADDKDSSSDCESTRTTKDVCDPDSESEIETDESGCTSLEELKPV